MLKDIDLTNKCGSCCHFKPIEDTATGECLQNPYNDSVVHDPKHPHWIVQRSRIKCPLYNAKPQTKADRIRAISDEELAAYWSDHYDEFCPNMPECGNMLNQNQEIPAKKCIGCALRWLQEVEL